MTAIAAAVDTLLSAELSSVSGAGVAGLISALEVQRRRLEAVDQRLVAEASERGVAGEYGRTSPADLLMWLLRISPAESKARVGRAQDLGPRRAITGERLEPLFPVVAEAVRAGEISAQHVAVIGECLDRIPTRMAHEVVPVAERLLVEAARHEQPRQLAKTARLLLARVDPDGAEPNEREMQRRRGFTLRRNPDGSSEPRGYFTPEATEAWQTILDALAAPVPVADGMPDQRSAGQRRHDAMIDAAMRLLRSGELAAAGGSPMTILASTTMRELGHGAGVAITAHGQPVALQQLLERAGEAEVIPVVCSQSGGILGYGRGRRLASRGQRFALAARDGGCAFPACDRPAAWTEVHHIQPWNQGGGTDVDNMCLLCRYHHREFAARDWEVFMQDGMPHWRPPPFIDPERKPIRNTAHHLTDFDFAA